MLCVGVLLTFTESVTAIEPGPPAIRADAGNVTDVLPPCPLAIAG